jgi:hypothetical protein
MPKLKIMVILLNAFILKVIGFRKPKTYILGISLMDLGVGAYIVIHSMKLIRNNSNLIRDQEL